MPTYTATRTLLAPRADVWAFVSEPHHMADWWPGIGGVTPDRRGFAPGARWAISGDVKPSLMRKAYHSGALVIRQVRPPHLAAWHLTAERFDVQLSLEEDGADATLATLTITGPFMGALRRHLPARALGRLFDLCQTAWPEDRQD
jgi:uncharacterized protein YndB with AHSA1/START domain